MIKKKEASLREVTSILYLFVTEVCSIIIDIFPVQYWGIGDFVFFLEDHARGPHFKLISLLLMNDIDFS